MLHTSNLQETSVFANAPGEPPAGKRRSSTARKQPTENVHGKRILLLGRVQELALYRAEFLRDRGFQVRTSTDHDEMRKLIHRGDFDAAVLSYTLSSGTVEELADELREHCPDCPLVVIAQTARADRKIAPDAVALADEGPKALIAALRRVFQHN